MFFDVDGNGLPERIAWTPADAEVAFLALDRDGDGAITSGKELFGNYTLPGSTNGFDALQAGTKRAACRKTSQDGGTSTTSSW